MQTEAEIEIMQPQVQDGWQWLEEARHRFSPEPLEEV